MVLSPDASRVIDYLGVIDAQIQQVPVDHTYPYFSGGPS